METTYLKRKFCKRFGPLISVKGLKEIKAVLEGP